MKRLKAIIIVDLESGDFVNADDPYYHPILQEVLSAAGNDIFAMLFPNSPDLDFIDKGFKKIRHKSVDASVELVTEEIDKDCEDNVTVRYR